MRTLIPVALALLAGCGGGGGSSSGGASGGTRPPCPIAGSYTATCVSVSGYAIPIGTTASVAISAGCRLDGFDDAGNGLSVHLQDYGGGTWIGWHNVSGYRERVTVNTSTTPWTASMLIEPTSRGVIAVWTLAPIVGGG